MRRELAAALAASAALTIGAVAARGADGASAPRILEAAGIKGGLVVVVGADDPTFVTGLKASGSHLVQALDTDVKKVATARDHIWEKGLYGKVSVAQFDGRVLPYADNLVNLIVIDSEIRVPKSEIERVLAPRGVAVWRNDGGSPELDQTIRKPVPTAIDDWSHYLHGPDGNPVARDRMVGPPKRMQWQAFPKWSRAHDSDSSIDAMVTAGGRIFYMADEAPASLSGNNALPDKWVLTARDAFNGVLLWKHSIEDWGWRAWKKTWHRGRMDTQPHNNRRIVATDDRLYVTLGYHAPVSELDAATGEVLQTYAGTGRAREVLFQNGQLILTVPEEQKLKLVVLDAATGKVAWQTQAVYAGALMRPHKRLPMKEGHNVLSAVADDKLVCFVDDKHLVCLDRKTGKLLWRVLPDPGNPKKTLVTESIITSGGVILYSEPNLLVALSANDGKLLWKLKKAKSWYPYKDVFVIDGLVWLWGPKFAGREPAMASGYDLQTGELKRSVPVGNIYKVDHHHRCYRNKATSRYLISSRRGMEFVNLEEGEHAVSLWARGICHLGMMPANGLLYAPPDPCKCYTNEKLNGFAALAGQESLLRPTGYGGQAGASVQVSGRGRLEKGKAYGVEPILPPETRDPKPGSWPTFRGDGARSGSTGAKLPAVLKPNWSFDLGHRLSPPTIAGGYVFVAQVDRHTVQALNSESGKQMWSHIAGGRVDSPPTYYRGAVLFGSADGWVTCLRASDGELVWKFRAAPRERLIGIRSQLESAWPVRGTILIDNDVAYVAAGRSSFLDGGIHVYALAPATGEILHQTVVDGPHVDLSDPDWFKAPRDAHGLGSRADVLQAVDGRICVGNKVFDRQLRDGGATPARTRALGGMLDDTQFRRYFWYYGEDMTFRLRVSMNHKPVAKIQHKHGLSCMLVNDKKWFYGVRRFDNTRLLNPRNHFVPGKGDLLFATEIGQETRAWSHRIPVRVTSMLIASDQLVVAGPPEEKELDPQDPLGTYEGRKSGVFWTFSTTAGEKIREYVLEAPPVFNGLAAAQGKLYAALTNGRLVCYGGEQQ